MVTFEDIVGHEPAVGERWKPTWICWLLLVLLLARVIWRVSEGALSGPWQEMVLLSIRVWAVIFFLEQVILRRSLARVEAIASFDLGVHLVSLVAFVAMGSQHQYVGAVFALSAALLAMECIVVPHDQAQPSPRLAYESVFFSVLIADAELLDWPGIGSISFMTWLCVRRVAVRRWERSPRWRPMRRLSSHE